MPSGTDHAIRLRSDDAKKMALPELWGYATGDRDNTLFTLRLPDTDVVLIGTFDQLIDFGAAIMGRMYTWSLLNGKFEWFTNSVDTSQSGETHDSKAS